MTWPRTFRYNGLSLTAAEWEARNGIPRRVIRGRILKHGWAVQDAVTKPLRLRGKRSAIDWTPELEATLKDLLLVQRLTRQQAAAELGLTKGMVSGKSWRMGLCTPGAKGRYWDETRLTCRWAGRKV